ncbi:MAG: MFS transporter [Chloroflexi bacterium]|nr:MFS transporter [Chloroflexota bacterium]MBV9598992.1 MFS transporter [Chloroflexota bacterium]
MTDLLKLATVDITPLRHRDFRLLFWGQLVSFLGSMVTYVAIPYQVYQLTHSPLMVGLLGLAQLGPILAFSMVGGAIADASDRRATVLATEVAFALLSALLFVNAILPEPQLWVIFVLAAMQAGLYALQRPSLDALMPRLVDKTDLTAAGALTATRGTIGMLLGPAIGGVLIATVGLPATYAVDALSFAASLVALALMRASRPVLGGERPSLRGVLDGWSFARSRAELIGTYVVDIVAMVFGMPEALFPAIAESLGGPAILGLLYSAPALGALIAAGTSGWTNHVRRHGLAVILAATIWGVAIIGFGLTTTPLIALPMLAIAGGADAVSGIFRVAIWNHTVPDELRGRLASIEMVSYTSGPALGNAESGLVAGLFSVQASVISGGVLCVLGCAVCFLLLPRFREYQTEAAMEPKLVESKAI